MVQSFTILDNPPQTKIHAHQQKLHCSCRMQQGSVCVLVWRLFTKILIMVCILQRRESPDCKFACRGGSILHIMTSPEARACNLQLHIESSDTKSTACKDITRSESLLPTRLTPLLEFLRSITCEQFNQNSTPPDPQGLSHPKANVCTSTMTRNITKQTFVPASRPETSRKVLGLFVYCLQKTTQKENM